MFSKALNKFLILDILFILELENHFFILWIDISILIYISLLILKEEKRIHTTIGFH